MKKLSSALFTFVLFAGGFYLILTRNPTIAEKLYNADMLYIETIYQGLFLKHQPLHNFIIMACPDFLQMLFYFTCRLFLNMPHAFIFATLLQIYLFYFLFLKIAKLISANPIELRLYQSMLLLSITLLAVPFFWTMDSFDQALRFDDHFFNTGIMTLLTLWLLLLLLFTQKNRAGLLICLFFTAFASALSDPSYLSCCALPALSSLALYFFYIKNARTPSLYSGFIILIASASGYILLKHLGLFHFNINYDHIINPLTRNIPLMLKQMLKGLILALFHNPPLFALWIFSVAYLFKINTCNEAMRFLRIFMIYLVTLSFFAMLFFDPDITAYASTEQLNAFFFLHISPAFYLPIFFMSIPLLQTELSQPRLKQTAHYSKACIFVMQTLLFIFLPQAVSLRYLFGNPDDNWPWIQCVRHAQQQYHLQQGIGDYWSSRPLTLYAHLPMAQINSEFNPYYWLVDISTLQANTADFIVTDNTILINSNVIAHYGLPAQIIYCSSNLASLDLLIYPHGIPINLARD